MRDLFFLILFAGILGRTVGAVQAGILGWTWLTLMTPQKLLWGVVADLPLNFALAILTFVVWFMSREPKRLPMNAAIVLCLIFMAFITFTTLFALAPELAWPRWSLAIKVMSLGLMVACVMTTRVRIHALVWVAVLSLCYYGVKGGLFTMATGGQFRVLAPSGSFGDNNSLALALCLILPFMNYLRLQSSNRFVSLGIVAAMGITALGILGTYSRGGLIGLVVVSAYLWWSSKSRMAIALAILVVAVLAYSFMPASWTERMGTIRTADADSSFQDRLQAWQTEFNIARERPFIGGGFNASESALVYQKYGNDPGGWPRAAHSIYFEVLGDHGYIGLALYLALLVVTWCQAGSARRKARRNPQTIWIADLASMIQVSLASFMVAGAALSMAYYDMVYLMLGVTAALKTIVDRSELQVEDHNDLNVLAAPTIVG